jgi:hypothetical protein
VVIFFIKIFLSASVIGLSSSLAARFPQAAGFLAAFPLTTLLVLLFNQAQYRDPANSIAFAKSICLAVPVSLFFFVPFLLAEKLRLSFWPCYFGGLLLLTGGFFIHRWAASFFGISH